MCRTSPSTGSTASSTSPTPWPDAPVPLPAPEDVRPAAELLARVVLSFAFRPTPWVDPHEPATVRRLVRTYLVPALTSPSEPEPSLSDRTTDPAQEST